MFALTFAFFGGDFIIDRGREGADSPSLFIF